MVCAQRSRFSSVAFLAAVLAVRAASSPRTATSCELQLEAARSYANSLGVDDRDVRMHACEPGLQEVPVCAAVFLQTQASLEQLPVIRLAPVGVAKSAVRPWNASIHEEVAVSHMIAPLALGAIGKRMADVWWSHSRPILHWIISPWRLDPVPRKILPRSSASPVDLRVMVTLMFVLYPAFFFVAFVMIMFFVACCFRVAPSCVASVDERASESCTSVGEMPNPQEDIAQPASEHWGDEERTSVGDEENHCGCRAPVPSAAVTAESFTLLQRTALFGCWSAICRAVPALCVFGIPLILCAVSARYPMEVWASAAVLSSTLMFANGAYIIAFIGPAVDAVSTAKVEVNARLALRYADGVAKVLHWVVVPLYKEDVGVVSMTLRSIRQNPSARSSVCVLLAMEERDTSARQTAEELKQTFISDFKEVFVTYHPAGLPNDPAGKASNVAWAFRELVNRLDASAQRAAQSVVLTIADGDTEFDPCYFDCVADNYVRAGACEQDLRIWQSPIFHLKNYYGQPSPVLVGSVLTTLMELASMSDPHAIRFPYSTYSLSLKLAKRVGGWDPEWIAEDWHMGLKCFLHTFGRARVEPIPLPTLNYTPEDASWCSTLYARWTQVKRHALGVSDISYYLALLPVAAALAASSCAAEEGFGRASPSWRAISVLLRGIGPLLKMVNAHIVLGLLTIYFPCGIVLRFIMHVTAFVPNLECAALFRQVGAFQTSLFLGTALCLSGAIYVFMRVHRLVEHRIDVVAVKPWWSRNMLVHGAYLYVCCMLMSMVYFTGLGLAVLRACWLVLVSRTFDYEVAVKPTLSRTS